MMECEQNKFLFAKQNDHVSAFENLKLWQQNNKQNH